MLRLRRRHDDVERLRRRPPALGGLRGVRLRRLRRQLVVPHVPKLRRAEDQGEEHLEAYWLEISKNQEKHTLELFKEKGLKGMYEYWDHIRIEENCDMDLKLDDEKLELRMNVCPSLSKVLDNDAEPMKRYCDHCAGWIGPLIDKVDHHLVYDVIDRNKPQCVVKIFKDKEKAIEEEKNAKLLMGWPKKKK